MKSKKFIFSVLVSCLILGLFHFAYADDDAAKKGPKVTDKVSFLVVPVRQSISRFADAELESFWYSAKIYLSVLIYLYLQIIQDTSIRQYAHNFMNICIFFCTRMPHLFGIHYNLRFFFSRYGLTSKLEMTPLGA